MRNGLPWILVGLIAGAWAGATWLGDAAPGERSEETTSLSGDAGPRAGAAEPSVVDDAALASQLAELQASVAALKSEVQSLRSERRAQGPSLSSRAEAGPPQGSQKRPRRVVTRDPEFAEREAKVREERLAREARMKRNTAARAQSKNWHDATRSLKDRRARETALSEMRAAMDGDNEAMRLAALRSARWLGNIEYDKADFRRGILPHIKSEDPEIRRAALEALAWVQPEPEDLAPWVEEAMRADGSGAEATAQALTRVSAGVIRGQVAEAVLHLLRDGTKIRKAFVMRGLQNAKEWDAAVEQRMIDVVRSVPARDYDSHYFFHFITSRMDPKSDAVLDLMLERLADGKSEIETISRGFRVGLDEAQKDRVASKLLDFAEDAPNGRTVKGLADGLRWTARRQHVDRMKVLISGDDVDAYVKRAMERAIRDAMQRS